MFGELELSGIADLFTNSNDFISWEDLAANLQANMELRTIKLENWFALFIRSSS